MYKGIKVIPKIPVDNKEILSLVYTPGVGSSCLKIEEEPSLVTVLTNKINSVAVISFDYEESLKRALFLKSTLLIDAYPLCLTSNATKEDIRLVVDNIGINFCGIDLSLISEKVQEIDFNIDIPILKGSTGDIKAFFKTISRNIFMLDTTKQLSGDTSEKSLQLHELAGGVIETELTEEERIKPLAIISDGTSVLGFGDIGAAASIPVLEGKTALYSELADIDGIVLALSTKVPEEIIKITQLLENSFSGIHLEDIAAPACFKIEQTLIETLKIPVFHDDQHGSAIIVLAGLLNSLILENKTLSNCKIVINGAGAAGSATARLLNLDMKKGGLKDVIKNADVFIGLSRGNLLTDEMVKSMAPSPIIFALANPIPEIMPERAQKDGAYIVATGRSDFPNQINNSLAFPGLFRGVLDAGVAKITDEIKLESALAIASLVAKDELSPQKIVPDGLDNRVTKLLRDTILSKFSK